MKRITEEEFWELYEMLPESLQTQIFSSKTASAIQGILERHDLMGEKGEDIPELVGNILLGVTPEEKLEAELEAMGIKKQKAEEVGNEIYNAVLKPVRIDLEKIQRNKKRKERLKNAPGTESEEESSDEYSESL